MSPIPDSIIESLKRNTSILALLKKYNIDIRKKGSNQFAICPFHSVDGHPESEPSLSIDHIGNQYHCFSCNTAGDVIKFVMDYEKATFPQAVEKLLALRPALAKAVKTEEKQNTKDAAKKETPEEEQPHELQQISEEQRQKLLSEVIDRSTAALRNRQEARRYLETRGLNPLQLLDHYTIGYWPADFLETVNELDKTALTNLGLYIDNRGMFSQCVLFPLRKDGRITTIYGRKAVASENKGSPFGSTQGRHYMLSCKREGLYLPKAGLNPRKPVVIIESIIDGLSLFTAGITNVLPLLGVNGFLPDHLSYLKQQNFPKIFIALNGDTAGHRAAAQLQQNLKTQGLSSEIIQLPEDKDINDLLLELGPEELKKWFLNKMGDQQTGEGLATVWEDGKDTWILLGTHEYRIRGLSPHGMDRLKINLLVRDVNAKHTFHVDTLDLYQSRSRDCFINAAAKLFSTERDPLVTEINCLITTLEELRLHMNEKESSAKVYQMSEAERNEALEYLRAPNLLDRIAADIEACGFAGNRNITLLAYIGALSRLTEKPVGTLINSLSAAGKSALQELIASFTPEENLLQMTRLTGQSLFYQGKDGLKHKLLTIEEDDGMRDALYAIRVLLSSQKLCVHSLKTDAQSGEYTVYENVVHGPASVMIATTDPAVFDAETLSRFCVLYLDESSAQTQKILDLQDKLMGPERLQLRAQRERITRLHRNIQRILKPLPVINRYGVKVKFPAELLSTRREKAKLGSLIETVALLHQYQREIKEEKSFGMSMQYIEVAEQDIESIVNLGKEMLSHSIDALPKHCRVLLDFIHQLVNEHYAEAKAFREEVEFWQVTFTRKELVDRTRWSRWHIEEHLEELEQAGYITRRMGKRGQKFAYSLVEESIPELPEVKI